MSDGTLLDRLRTLALGEKHALDNPSWSIIEGRSGRKLSCVCPLSQDDAISSGLRLTMEGPQATLPGRPFYGLIAQLFATERARNWHLGRIEFDPETREKPHRNPLGRHNAPPLVRGPHVHDFEASVALKGIEALTPLGNLPIAFPLDILPSNFDDILETVRSRFNIPGLWMEEPSWSRTLL